MSFSYDYLIYSLYYLLLLSHFSLALEFCIYSSLYETVHVAWIKINIQCKSFSLNVKNKFETVVGRAVVVTLKASDRGAVVKIILMDKTCKFHELWLNTELIFGDNPKAYGKILLAFSRGNQFHANSRSAYRVTS